MAITFHCGCGKSYTVGDDLAGKKAKCKLCEAILTIPRPTPPEPVPDDPRDFGLAPEAPARASKHRFDDEPDDGQDYALADQPPAPPKQKVADDEYAIKERPLRPRAPEPSTFHPSAGGSVRASQESGSAHSVAKSGSSSIREYLYFVLAFTFVPLAVSLLGGKPEPIEDRIRKTLEAATPEEAARIEQILEDADADKDVVLRAMPGGKFAGAHLAHDSQVHWIYATISAIGFLCVLLAFFDQDRVHPGRLFATGLFTGTVGIGLLLLFQFCASLRLHVRVWGRGILALIVALLMFIGWSYQSALDPDANFIVSALGYTFGVGLCEELCKSIPMIDIFRYQSDRGWRAGCLVGLASGVGFGVSEGIMYSATSYNGIGGGDIYLVRFISCVALHAMWSASVGISMARRVDLVVGFEDFTSFLGMAFRVLAVPMVLHGLYDTLLKMDMEAWALAIAVLSFGVLAFQIEAARGSEREQGARSISGVKRAY